VKAPAHAPKVRDYLHMLAQAWFVIVLATALSAGMGWVSWRTMTPVYQSSSRVLVTTPGAATTFDAFYGQMNSMSRTLSYQILARSNQVTGLTIEQLGLGETTDELAARITVVPSASTVLDLVVTGSDPTQTRELAQAVTTNLVDVQHQTAKVDGSGAELVELDGAGVAHRVGSMWRTVIQGAAIGLVLSMFLVIAYTLIRDRLLGRGQLGRIVAETDAELTR
jgi:capsular polysaccharide biosynthesis protein